MKISELMMCCQDLANQICKEMYGDTMSYVGIHTEVSFETQWEITVHYKTHDCSYNALRDESVDGNSWLLAGRGDTMLAALRDLHDLLESILIRNSSNAEVKANISLLEKQLKDLKSRL